MHFSIALLTITMATAPFITTMDGDIDNTKVSREIILPSSDDDRQDALETTSLPGDGQTDNSTVQTTASTLHLTVAVVTDPQMPPLNDSDIQQILATAQQTISDKLAFSELSFEVTAKMSVEDFIERSLKNVPACLNELAPIRYTQNQDAAFTALRPKMLTFLKKWSLKELQSFFPVEEQGRYTSHEAVLEQVIATYRQKAAAIAKIRLADKQKLLDSSKLRYRSYSSWVCALRGQEDYDIILTNEFIFYDLIGEPFPHTVFQKCKVGGASLPSPKRIVIPGRALFVSTFGIENKIPFFDEDPQNRFSHDEKQQLTGMFLLAHELGHALFKLPDFYDHPEQCLMTTKAETDYQTGYTLLKNNPGTCPACQPWVTARRDYFRAIWLREHGQVLPAIELFKQVSKNTPHQIDGTYRQFLADIGLNIAICYHLLDNKNETRRWLKGAIKMDPQNSRAQQYMSEWFEKN